MDIKKAIRKNGQTISSVAEALGITQSALSQQINNNSITLAKVEQIAQICGCSLNEFTKGEESSEFMAFVIRSGGEMYSASSIPEARMLLDKLDEKK
jgi:transcriptional regulator with XRE-family HTH domain